MLSLSIAYGFGRLVRCETLIGHVKLLFCAMGPNSPLSALRKASIGRFNTTLQLASILAIDTVEV